MGGKMGRKCRRDYSFNGFSINLFQDNDQDWIAHFVELPNVSAFAETPEEAILELKTAWDLFRESCYKHLHPVPIAPTRRNYSGHFNVRVGKKIHKELAIEAEREGVPLEHLITQKLSKNTENGKKPANPA